MLAWPLASWEVGGSMPTLHECRLCGTPLTRTLVDLGMSPLCESYVPAEKLDDAEVFYPLHVRLCDACLLVQLPAYVSGEDIFSDYAYFSSYSDSWVAHAKRYAEAMIGRLDLTPDSLVTEVASNDGYLLQHFQAAGVPVLGVEPAANVAEAARARGIRTEVQFLGAETGRQIAQQYGRADLVAAKPRMSGTWAKTLFAATRSARPYCRAIWRPVSAPRNWTSVRIPRARAASATFAAGSTPSTGTPAAWKC